MFNSVIASPMSLTAFLICELSALFLGFLAAVVFTRGEHHSGAYAQTLALLPPVVALVIMLVNGNIGAGLAVAGTFALVRFRSAPGSAKEITGIFFAVALGLACGMGFVGFAVLFFVILAAATVGLERLHFGEPAGTHRQLKITIPENLNYEELFDDLFAQYTRSHELTRVRTTNMGTLYELVYAIELKDPDKTKEFIDEIRCRNGNLNIVCSREAERDVM